MARGDGKARKGLTKASKPRYGSDGVQRMAFGGKPGESAMSRAEASRPGPSSSGGGLGSSSRDGGFGGASGSRSSGGGSDRPVGGAGREGGGGTGSQRDVTRGYGPANPSTAKSDMLRSAQRPESSVRMDLRTASMRADDIAQETELREAVARDALSSPTGFRGTASSQAQGVFPSSPRSTLRSPEVTGGIGSSPFEGGFRRASAPPVGYSGSISPRDDFTQKVTQSQAYAGPTGFRGAPGSQFLGVRPSTSFPTSSPQFAELARIREEAKRSLAELDRQNLGLPSQIAPFQSGKGSPPVKTISERLPVGSIKDQSRLPAGYTGPTVGPVYTPPATTTSPLPRPRPVQPVVSPPAKPKPASFAPKEKREEGSVFTKNGVRYQIRDGKAYNFNVPGSSKAKSGGRDKDLERLFRGKKDGGAVRNTDGIATSGKTKGRYI